MKYVLVDNYDCIVTRANLSDDVGISGARTYFKGVKQMPDGKKFDKLWRVMTEEQWDIQFKSGLQNRQMGQRKYEWWKDDTSYLDIDK